MDDQGTIACTAGFQPAVSQASSLPTYSPCVVAPAVLSTPFDGAGSSSTHNSSQTGSESDASRPVPESCPPQDPSLDATIPPDVRLEADRWSLALSSVTPPIGAALHRLARELGVSPATARRNWDKFRKGGASALINRAKAPQLAARSLGLHPDTIEYWKSLCEQNQRKCRPAWKLLKRQWWNGTPIPGVDPALSRSSLPRGWSYGNLMRHAPSPFELTATRIGRSAASDHRPQVLTTRVGLQVGQFYQFDDVWHDFKVLVYGQATPRRLLQLSAFDLFSACNFARGIKPRVEDPETGKSVNLTEGEMLFLLAHVLETYGFHPDGCTLMLERGTATVDDATERLLYDLTGGKLRVQRAGVTTAPALALQFPGRSKGNFRWKASLESWHNPLHNETANLLEFPGQTGSNSRLNEPEELTKRDAHTRALIAACAALPPELASRLRADYLESSQAILLVNHICERLNLRTEHDLEGWVEAGLTAVEYALPGNGRLAETALQALPPEQRQAVLAVATPGLRKLSPREVFNAGRSHLTRLRPEQTALLLAGRFSREVTVRNRLIEFQDAALSPSPLIYKADTWADGDRFALVVNPFDTRRAHLFDARGAWRGTVDECQRAARFDTDALNAQMGYARKVEKLLLRGPSQRGAQLTHARLADTLNNIAVLTEAKKLLAQGSAPASGAVPCALARDPSSPSAASPSCGPQDLASDPDLDALLAPAAPRPTSLDPDYEIDDFLSAVTSAAP